MDSFHSHFAQLNEQPESVVYARIIGPTPGGGFSLNLDGLQYDGVPTLGFQHSPGEPVQVAFSKPRSMQEPLILSSGYITQGQIPTAPATVLPLPPSAVPWGMLGGDNRYSHFTAGPSVVPTLSQGTGLLSDCTQITMQGVTSAIGCVSPGYGLLAVASSAYVSFFSNGSRTWTEFYLSPSGNYQADIQQILCSASTVYVIEYTKPTNTGGGGGGTAGA